MRGGRVFCLFDNCECNLIIDQITYFAITPAFNIYDPLLQQENTGKSSLKNLRGADMLLSQPAPSETIVRCR